jgi:hypothetical protein
MVEEREGDEPAAEWLAGVSEETSPELSAAEKMILSQTNAFRKQQQLDALKPNAKLNETAQDFADFMARTGKYGHTAAGKRPSERVGNHGYAYCLVAENIANQFRSTGFTADGLAKAFVSGWRNSPEHRKNMLDPDVTDIGVAIARRSDSPRPQQDGLFRARRLSQLNALSRSQIASYSCLSSEDKVPAFRLSSNMSYRFCRAVLARSTTVEASMSSEIAPSGR